MAVKQGVFISYARSDGEDFATALRERLLTEGVPVIQDRVKLEGGRDWWLQIKDAIETVEFMVLVMTPAAMRSEVVRKEWRYARQKGVCVYPVKAGSKAEFDALIGTLPRWMRDLHVYDIGFDPTAFESGPEWRKLVNDLNTRCDDPHVPFMCEDLPADFVPRPGEFEALLSQLLNDSRDEPVAITAALKGAGGYGKTTLARALCHNEHIQQAFDDGVLWVTLGEKVDNLIDKVTDLIEVLGGERPGFTGLEAATTRLVELLADRDILIVIDDVWNAAHLRPFLQGGKRCARLITTRSTDTLPPDALKTTVDAMQADEAVSLLGAGLPDETVAGHQPVLHKLAGRLGEWALLLKLANGVLRNRVIEKKQPFSTALDYLEKALDKKGLIAFDRPNDQENRHSAVDATIQVSLGLLDIKQRAQYAQLAIFPEDVDIPLSTLEKLWGLDDFDTEELCGRFDSLSLLVRFDLNGRTIRLHDVVRFYLMVQHGSRIAKHGKIENPKFKAAASIISMDPNLYLELAGELPQIHARFLDAHLLTYGISKWADLPHDEPYLWDWLVYHLVEAGRMDGLIETALDLNYVAVKTYLRGTAAVEGDLLAAERAEQTQKGGEVGDSALRLLHRQYVNMAHLLNRARSKDEISVTLYSRLYQFAALNEACMAILLPKIAMLPYRPLPDLPPPALIRTLDGHDGPVRSVAYSPDGRFIVSSSWDETIRVWEVATGKELQTLTGHSGQIINAVYSSNGQFIASVSFDKTIRVWDAASGSELRTLLEDVYWVTNVVYSPDGRFIAAGAGDQTVRVWESATGTEVQILAGHTNEVNSLAYSPDGRFIASGSDDQTIRVWDVVSGSEVWLLTGHADKVSSVIYSPDGRFITSAAEDGMILTWDSATGIKLRILVGHLGKVTSVAYSPDGQFIASTSIDQTIRVWESATGLVLRIVSNNTNSLSALAYSPDGQFIASSSYEGTIQIWEASTSADAQMLVGHHGRVSSTVYNPNGQSVVSASDDKTIRIWDVLTGAEMRVLVGHRTSVMSAVYSPDGKFIVSASWDQTIRVWEAATGIEMHIIVGHSDFVNSVAYSPDGRFIISASDDGTIRVWEGATGAEARALAGHTRAVTSVAYSPDGQFITSGSRDKTIRVWEATTGTEVRTLVGHTEEVNSAVYSPDGQLIVSSSWDGTIRVWMAATGGEVVTLEEHSGPVNSVAFSPDGRYIVSAASDKTIRLWEVISGSCQAVLYIDDFLYTCAFHPDGEHIVAGGERGLYWLKIVQ